jgi:hypothetical protein
MEKMVNIIFSGVHLLAALILIALSLIIMGWSVYEVISSIGEAIDFIPLMLQSVGAIIISAAIIDVAKYMMEEEVFLNKELRDPEIPYSRCSLQMCTLFATLSSRKFL